MATKYSYEIEARVEQAKQALASLSEESNRLRTSLEALGQVAAATNLGGLQQKLQGAFQPAITDIETLNQKIRQLEELQATLASGQKLSSLELTTAQNLGVSGRVTAERVGEALTAAKAEADALSAKLDQGAQKWNQGLNQGRILLGQSVKSLERIGAGSLDRMIQGLVSGSAAHEAVTARIVRLNERLESLYEKQARVKGAIERGTGGRTADRIPKELAAAEKAIKATTEARATAEARVNQALTQGNVSVARRLKLEKELEQAIEAQYRAQDNARQIQQSVANLGFLGGLADELQLTEDQITQTKADLLELGTAGEKTFEVLEAAVPGVTATYEQFLQVSKEVNALVANPVERGAAGWDEYVGKLEAAKEKQKELALETMRFLREVRAARDVKVVDPQEWQSQLGFLTKTLVGAFDGFVRRFQATLQFALSAAVIFGTQRLARELVQTAIEVERAFADIESALEFDIGFDRGTAEFNDQVEEVRRKVLLAANDLNVLPTVANEIAFKMVSRFRNIDNAIEASRAQMLALKISTIDSDEVLRALTATAEGFAASIFYTNSSLSNQEKLIERETAAVKNYAKALDLATQIQQTWGVDVEDSLEGTARATEVFSQMGFSMQQTMAIVAATSFRLGQTGQQVAERLNRSIGQITSPEIRDQLLDLAVASEAFNLTLEDFDTGATALAKIAAQFERIEKVDPDTARQLIQIIGQRREIEVVATVLGTQDIQQDILAGADRAVGAAEKRFSFLRNTTSEILKSISTGFQELAQNLERLGALSPFKLILSTADVLLQTLNRLLKYVESFFRLLDRLKIFKLGDMGFGELASNLLSAILAVKTLKSILKALGESRLILAGKEIVGSAAARAAGGAPAGAAAAGLTAALAPGLERFGTALNTANQATKNAFASLRESLKRASLSTLTVAGAQGRHVAAIETERAARARLTLGLSSQAQAGLGFAAKILAIIAIIDIILQTVDGFKSLREAQESYEKSVRDTETAIAEQILSESITDSLEQSVLRTTKIFEDLNSALAGETTTLGERFAAALSGDLEKRARNLDPIDEEERRKILGIPEREGRGSARDFLPPGALVRSLQPGTEEFSTVELTRALKDKITADVNKSLSDVAKAISTAGFLDDPDPAVARRAQDLQKRGQAILRMAAESFTPDAIERLQKAQQEYSVAYLEFLAEQELLAEQIEATLNSIRQEVKNINFKVATGELTRLQAVGELEVQRQDALNRAAAAPDETQAQEFQNLAQEIWEEQNQKLIENVEKNIETIELFNSETEAARQKLTALRNLWQQLTDRGASDAAGDVLVQIVQAERDFTQSLINQAQNRLNLINQFGSTIREQIEALQDYQAALNRIIQTQFPQGADRKAVANSPAYNDAIRLIEGVTAQIGSLIDEENVRRVIAEAQATGPILSNLNSLSAQLDGARVALSQLPKGSVEAVEKLNEINRLVAQIAQEQLKAAQAFVLYQAGVNDQLTRLKGEITNVAHELQLAAQLYGKNSAEYYSLLLRQEELKNALANAQLALRDLNRRLESDVTNSFEQAQLDLIAIMEKLQAPDLGELERAQLELEKKNAEAAAQRSFFDDKMFGLKFDYETGKIGLSAYIAGLEALLESVDTSTQQGKEIFLQIQSLIDSLTDSANSLQFNIPTEIRLPTLFEIRRSLAADELAVNYVDNRTQTISIEAGDQLTLEQILSALDTYIPSGAQRVASGSAGITQGWL